MSEHVDKVERSTKRLPKGNYALVSVDVDTTGRRLIDEIVQLAAYTPDEQFGQYIMPIMNLNPAARQRHQIRVITVGFFRMLKSMQTYKVVKTKPEIQTLKDFLSWLEKVNAGTPGSLGVIMIYHEQRKFIPYVILEAMGKYGLLPRFFSTVKSFADGFALAEATLDNSVKYFTLKQLAKVILQHEEVSEKDRYDFEGNASVRTRLAYQIIEKLALKDGRGTDEAAGGQAGADGDKPTDAADAGRDAAGDSVGTSAEKMLQLVCEYATPMNEHVAALNDQTKCVERQHSLRPIFVNYFKVTLYHRVKAVTFRRILADHGYDLEMLHEIWEAKKSDGLHEAIAPMDELKEEERTELVEMLDSHFDPEKQAVLPLVKKHKTKRGGGGGGGKGGNNNGQSKENAKMNNSGNNGVREPMSPDSLSKTPQKRSRRRRSSLSAKMAELKATAAKTNGESNNHHTTHQQQQQQQPIKHHQHQIAESAHEEHAADIKAEEKNNGFSSKVDAVVNGIQSIEISANTQISGHTHTHFVRQQQQPNTMQAASKPPSAARCRQPRNFVREASVARFDQQKSAAQPQHHHHHHHQPGVYERHHPAKCEHILKNRPIHLKRSSATEAKEICTIVTQDTVRRLLVPSDTVNVYPTIWSTAEMGRIRDESTIVTKQQQQQLAVDVEAQKQRMEHECEERKRQLRALDGNAKRGAGGGGGDADGCGKRSTDEDAPGRVLDRAFVARQEQTAEVQRANRLIMAAKCHVIRDAQVAEKNELKSEMRDEELRLERMMELERTKALHQEDLRRQRAADTNAQHGVDIKAQLRERELVKLAEAERIEAEAAAMAQGQISITLDLIERERQRRQETLRFRTELQHANQLNDRFRSLAFEEQRIADMKAAEFMRQKQERDRQRAADARLAREAKQRDADRMLVLQKQLLDSRTNQDEMIMRRAQEEKEREFRRKQKEAAELKIRRGQEMERARTEQLEAIKRERALNIVREEMDFRGVVEQLEQAAARERVEAERKHASREKYRSDVMQQIKDKEMARRAGEKLEREQHVQQLEQERERERNIQAVISAKISSMRHANIPDRFIKDVQRNLEAAHKFTK